MTSRPPFQPSTFSQTSETAILAGGCFWGVQELIRALPGVIRSTVGYTGGRSETARYVDVKTGQTDHAEAIRIEFDPNLLSYEELLRFFFRLHDPTQVNRQMNDIGTQYRSAIFFLSEEQRETAERVKNEVDTSGKWSKPIATQLVPALPFYDAEKEHQDYLQKHPDGYNCHWVRD
jgi:methionine-S-sulfoxide reductase